CRCARRPCHGCGVMAMTNSPAPFTVEPADHLGDPAYAVRAADGDLIAVGMVKADAHLLAAAPDMLSIHQDSVEILEIVLEEREEIVGEDEVMRDLIDRI